MCALCGRNPPKHGKLGWHLAGSGEAKWLHDNSIVDEFLANEYGFFVEVPLPGRCTHVWTAAHLGVDYRGPLPARKAYTGSAKGPAMTNVIGFPSPLRAGDTLRLRAPVAYKDIDGQVYPPHAHCLVTKGKVLTLPFLIPTCGYSTALDIARNRKSAWAVVYVLNNLDTYGVRPLPRTVNLTESDQIHRRFSVHKPLLLYCAHSKCSASHTMAKKLLDLGHSLVAVFSGGMREVMAHSCHH